ncbi:hypothetical protein KUCAC02_004216 [Chaenocephalus aceratus]|uniref:Uncharacterized protein n=1 Tax=Chaenocephalus aceratus TaxID=36190 RepID=A0ACB9WZQ9_CHAAC|nr:hypothetical protein KUCAC02_004216 [Chaenocephalus aceratus]
MVSLRQNTMMPRNSSDSENEERIETESENKEKETGIENEETGIENDEMEGEEIEREEMENEAVTSESTRVKAPSELFVLLQLPNSTNPAHIQKNNIKYNEAFVKFSNSIGPRRPLVQFPTNQDGRSFQGHWYDENPWLEYSPQNDAMYCFSCRI